MSCATCSGTIEDAVEELDGVAEMSANFASDEGVVTYDPAEVSLSEVYDAIEGAGYDPERASRTVSVTGMSCATCAETIEGSLADVPGVLGTDANFASDEVVVRYNPADVAFADIYAAIESAGYDPVETDADGGRERAIERELGKQRRLALRGGLLTLPFVPVMLEMLLPVDLVPATVLGVPVGYAEFALATAMMGTLGREFLRGAYRAFANDRRANMDTLVAVGTSAGYLYSTAAVVGAVL